MIYYIFYQVLYSRFAGGESFLVKALNVFQYVTFRTAYAAITALLISLIFGGRAIKVLRNWNVGQQIREEGLDGLPSDTSNVARGATADPARLRDTLADTDRIREKHEAQGNRAPAPSSRPN